jgi:hypothetical protein
MKFILGAAAAGIAAFALAFGASAIAPPKADAAPPAVSAITVPVDSAIVGGGSFTGDLTLERFASEGGQLIAIGTLSGELVDAAGVATTLEDEPFSAPVSVAQATCDILELTLGPLDLDLLGLVISLDTVHLEIDAEPGPGNLLGNLLCGIAGLLDSGGTTNAIARLLNQLLGLLG